MIALVVLPSFVSSFALDLVTQTALAAVGALALNVLTGLAGQVSLGHAGFIAAGAFTTAILVEDRQPSPLLTLPAAPHVGAVLGVLVGVPALRLKGLYLALGTLAMHHVVLYACGELQARWGANTGVSIPPPRRGAWVLRGTVGWYYALTAVAAVVLVLSANLRRSRAGRAWMAIRDREIAAESVGIDVARYKVLAFVRSSRSPRCRRGAGDAPHAHPAGQLAAIHSMTPGVVNPVTPTFTGPRDNVKTCGNSGAPAESYTFAET